MFLIVALHRVTLRLRGVGERGQLNLGKNKHKLKEEQNSYAIVNQQGKYIHTSLSRRLETLVSILLYKRVNNIPDILTRK